jgi:hypothetical protein
MATKKTKDPTEKFIEAFATLVHRTPDDIRKAIVCDFMARMQAFKDTHPPDAPEPLHLLYEPPGEGLFDYLRGLYGEEIATNERARKALAREQETIAQIEAYLARGGNKTDSDGKGRSDE